jgi:hypothetical protein
MHRGATLLVLSLAACTDGPGRTATPALDPAAYAASVHPIMEARCATLDCHGDLRRSLRLYSETGLRLRDDLRDQPLTPAELAGNVSSLAGVDPEGQGRLIMEKALADEVHHVGGDQWQSTGEPQAACVLAWLEGRSDEPAAQTACALAGDEVALPD